MRTNQQIFDNVVTNLRKQGCKSEAMMPPDFNGDCNMGCAYRTPEGHKCAAGWELPDEHYDPSFENQTVYMPTNSDGTKITQKFLELGYTSDNLRLLNNLQDVHDSHKVENWETEFVRVAKDYNLTMPA